MIKHRQACICSVAAKHVQHGIAPQMKAHHNAAGALAKPAADCKGRRLTVALVNADGIGSCSIVTSSLGILVGVGLVHIGRVHSNIASTLPNVGVDGTRVVVTLACKQKQGFKRLKRITSTLLTFAQQGVRLW